VPEGEELWKLFLVIALNKIRRLGAFHRSAKRDIGKTAVLEAPVAESTEPTSEDSLRILEMTINEVIARLPEGGLLCESAGEDAFAQALLDAIHRVKKVPAIHPQFAGTQLPVRSQQKVIAEQAMLKLRQCASGDQTKIGDILLVFPAPRGRPVSSLMRLERNPAQVLLLRNAAQKAVVADTENRAQNAITRLQNAFPSYAQS
jgi:hypothetical protein